VFQFVAAMGMKWVIRLDEDSKVGLLLEIVVLI